jgi:Ca2+-transporting ATPase
MQGKSEGRMSLDWHTTTIKETLETLGVTESGLSGSEAKKRLHEYGPNELKEVARKTPLMMIADQFKDFMIIVLVAAAVVSGIIGEAADTIAIVVIVILNAIIGFIQEYRAEKAMQALKKMAAPAAIVMRDGEITKIPARDLVPGDIVFLEAGNIVPADMRIIDKAQLSIEEAALTGESVPVEKFVEPLKGDNLPLGDRKNMVFKGTVVSYGRGKGVVVATGMETELGKIATLLQEGEEVKTPLQKRLAAFGKRLGLAVIGICAIVFGFGLLRGEDPLVMFLTAVSLAVAAVPEALPAVVTISLALGARKMVKENALVRKLPAVETLGSVTYICSDKTGTLTMNRMSVEEIYLDGRLFKRDEIDETATKDPLFRMLMIAMSLNNDAGTDSEGNLVGDPTETAMFEIAKRAGYVRQEVESKLPRIEEIPFDSDRKCMTTFHEVMEDGFLPGFGKGDIVSFTKGALESMAEKSIRRLTNGDAADMTGSDRDEIISANERMAGDGLRTLGFGLRRWNALPHGINPDTAEKELIFMGIVGLLDPPREEAKEAVRLCKQAGIKPVMITGDHPLTARTIAKRLDIIDDGDGIITGQELQEMSLESFEEKVKEIRVYARVAPEQKIKIVKALQDRGEFVAMTGDGVNDAPALKRADIGVAMGITGTDVAKEASHMILLDDNFATIVRAVKEGRRIFDNIRKFIRYTMTSNAGEIWTIFLAPFLGLPIPLLPIHILWVNLVTDGLPGLAYAMEPAEKDIMKRPPRHPQENIFTGMWKQIIWIGLLMGGVTLGTQAITLHMGFERSHWQTMVFTVLCLSQMGNAFALRSEKEAFFRQGMFSNMAMFWAVMLTLVLQLSVIYVPVMNRVFKTAPLTAGELAATLGVSTIVFFAVEAEKFFLRRRVKNP